jgi:hypothetical protein
MIIFDIYSAGTPIEIAEIWTGFCRNRKIPAFKIILSFCLK